MTSPTTTSARPATPPCPAPSDRPPTDWPNVPSPFVLTAITRDPALAALCDAAGVDRIGVDIERLGKTSRQGHVPNARISDHELGQLRALGAVVRHATLFARLNPLHDGSGAEVDQALDAGARVLMLPFHSSPGNKVAMASLPAS